MMQFPITDLLSEQECYNSLLRILHPDGLKCPCGHGVETGQAPHMSDRAPIVEYRCRRCGKVFNLFTDTDWCRTRYDCRTIVMVLRGFVQGVPTLHLSKELNLDYETLLNRRHQWQAKALKKKRRRL